MSEIEVRPGLAVAVAGGSAVLVRQLTLREIEYAQWAERIAARVEYDRLSWLRRVFTPRPPDEDRGYRPPAPPADPGRVMLAYRTRHKIDLPAPVVEAAAS